MKSSVQKVVDKARQKRYHRSIKRKRITEVGFGNNWQQLKQSIDSLKEAFNGNSKAVREELKFLREELIANTKEVKTIRESQQKTERQLEVVYGIVDDMQTKVEDIQTKVDILIKEVGRLSSRGELMLSIFGYCALNDLAFTRGELAAMGRKATRFSNINGYKVETVADNTFGFVNVYERKALDTLFLGEED